MTNYERLMAFAEETEHNFRKPKTTEEYEQLITQMITMIRWSSVMIENQNNLIIWLKNTLLRILAIFHLGDSEMIAIANRYEKLIKEAVEEAMKDA